MSSKTGILASAAALLVVTAPLNPASAHEPWHHGAGLLFVPFAVVGAIVAGAAAAATAPLQAPATPYGYAPPAPGYYAPPAPAYYAPPATAYYAPAPYAYAPAPYVYAAPRYRAPRGYYYRHY